MSRARISGDLEQARTAGSRRRTASARVPIPRSGGRETTMPRILVLGAGFAGLWAAIGAARKLEEIGSRASDVEVLVVDRNPYHNVRVRNYEAELGDVTIALGEVLDP